MTPDLRPRFPEGPSLYLVVTRGQVPGGDWEGAVRAALRGGVGIVQLREKGAGRAELRDLGRRLRDLARAAGAAFVVNDDPRLAVELEADGVHVGQGDVDTRTARALVGPRRWIGLSTHDPAQVAAAKLDREVDMIGLGPVFPTRTKDAGAPIGCDPVVRASRELAPRPVFAIGGIDLDGARRLAALGCRRAALSSAVLGAADPEAAAAEILRALSS